MPDTLGGKRIVVATAGHVDHGKTSLIRALTGVDTDRLPEEKRRGISIELGFAELEKARVSFIDVPGHQRLVHTMVAGVGGVDAVLLVVAADDGVMPQTREHLAVASLLGVRRVLVALSKCDLVDAETAELAEVEVRETLARFALTPTAVVRTSAETGEGIALLEQRLTELVAEIKAREPSQRVWLGVDRVFSQRGAGTVVTGTLTRGKLKEGDLVYLATAKGMIESACRTLHVHGRKVPEVWAPTRLAVNLSRVAPDVLHRGDVLTTDAELPLSRRIDVAIEWLPGVSLEPNRHPTLVAHLGTARSKARLRLLSEQTAQLLLERAVPCEGGLGFVLRSLQAERDFGRVVGGGRVLDALAPVLPRRRDKQALEQRLEACQALARGDVIEGLLGVLRCTAPRPVSDRDLERRLGLSSGSVVSVFKGPGGRAIAFPLHDQRHFTTQAGVQDLIERASRWLAAFHQRNPHELGAPQETLRAELAIVAGRLVASQALELALESGRLSAVDATLICLPEFAKRSAHAHDDALERVRRTLGVVGLTGANEQEIAERAKLTLEGAKSALARLAKSDQARRLSGLWFGETELSGLRRAVRAHLQRHATLSVLTFKELFGVSRKQAIPLLEDLDQRGVTRRQGDQRVLGKAQDK